MAEAKGDARSKVLKHRVGVRGGCTATAASTDDGNGSQFLKWCGVGRGARLNAKLIRVK
jgi:hypothetical protein